MYNFIIAMRLLPKNALVALTVPTCSYNLSAIG
jgi:hypothetical protein